jgi:hypothetical protein
MLFIGLLLLAATGAFTGLAIADNLSGGPEYTVSVLDHDIATMSTLAIFCSGLALALIFCLGLAMAMRGAVHRRHSRPRAHRTQVAGPDTMAGPHLQH